MSLPLIELKDVQKRYLNKTFNLVVHSGDHILITGANGSGKSTLLLLILSLIKPDRGRYIKRIKYMQYIPERVFLPGHMDVTTYLEIISKVKKERIRDDLIHLLKIPIHQKIDTLSKGNLQKIALYQAKIGHPSFFVFDEPLSGLDYDMKHVFKSMIKEMIHHQKTCIIATHDQAFFKDLNFSVMHL